MAIKGKVCRKPSGLQKHERYSMYCTSHSCDISRESRHWSANESVSIRTNSLLYHADVVLI